MRDYTILGIKFTKTLLPRFIKVVPRNSLYLKYSLPASHCPTPNGPSSVPYSQSKIPTWNWRAPGEEMWKSLKAGTKLHWSKRREKWSNSFFKLKPRIYQPSSWGHLALTRGDPNLSLQKADGEQANCSAGDSGGGRGEERGWVMATFLFSRSH